MSKTALVIGKRADGSTSWSVNVEPGRRVRSVEMPDSMTTGDVVRVYVRKVSIRFNVTVGPWAGQTRIYTVALDSIRPTVEFDSIAVVRIG